MAVEDVPALKTFVGDSATWPVEITVDGTALDITGFTISVIVSATREGASLLQVDVTSHTDPTAGETEFTLTDANLVTIGGAGEYWLHIVAVDLSGYEVTYGVATLTVYDRPART